MNELSIKIMMLDGCTEKEAIKLLNNGTSVFCDFEENFLNYANEWNLSEEEKEDLKKMIDTKIPTPDWSIVNYENKYYYIMYVL